MDIRALRYFLAVAHEENITKAADYLHVTQPTLSRQLMTLEDEFGKQLFIREKRRVTLTQDGILFRKRATEIVDLVDKTEAEMKEEREIAGDIFLAAGETDVIRSIAEVANELCEEHQGIRLRLFSGDGDYVRDHLDKGLADFGLLFGPVDQLKYNLLPLNKYDRWGVLMPDDCDLAQNETIKPADLQNRRLILSQQALDGGFLQAWLNRELSDLNVSATYTLILNAAKMTAGGLGIAMVIDGLINTKDSGLVFRPLDPPLEASMSLIWKKYQVFTPAAEAFLTALQEAFEA